MHIKTLKLYGLDDFFITQLNPQQLSNYQTLTKVIGLRKNYYQVINNDNQILYAVAKQNGKYLYDNIVVGDFVLLQTNYQMQDKSYIISILKRKNMLKRTLMYKNHKTQVLCSNIDYAFLCIPVYELAKINKIERFLLVLNDAHITPVIIITKMDLLTLSTQQFYEPFLIHFQDYTIFESSYIDHSILINNIYTMLAQDKIGILFGISGAGKSTICNALLTNHTSNSSNPYHQQKTAEVNKLNYKGQHTTTSRDLFLLPTGGCIIDNPGIKEFGLELEDQNSLTITFAFIKQLASKCKFNNCSHHHEPQCAVKQAVEQQQLSQQQYYHYLKLSNEAKINQQLKKSTKHKTKAKHQNYDVIDTE